MNIKLVLAWGVILAAFFLAVYILVTNPMALAIFGVLTVIFAIVWVIITILDN